ncbi:MAG: metallophosphoesterase [Bdellovibrio sp.]
MEAKVEQLRKIKLVISDLHLGKGRQLENGGANPFEEFYYDEKLVEFFQYYCSGAFRDCEIELIINGDFLNFLQVDYRGHFLTVLTESVCLEILKTILDGHPKVFAALREWGQFPNRTITYVMGNHDQAMLWPACRQLLNSVLGCQIRFKSLVYFFEGVHIEHGHMHEAANRFDPRRFFLKKDLPEPILNLPFGSLFFVELVLKIKKKYPFVDKIRPFSRMLRWSLSNQTWMTLSALSQLMVYLLRTGLQKDPRKRITWRSLGKVVWESTVFPDLGDSARKLLQDSRIHTVIFGHSHVYQYRQLSLEKEYLNTGTWTEITSLDLISFGKITKLTYVMVEYFEQSQRPRCRLKEWKGYHRMEEDVVLS